MPDNVMPNANNNSSADVPNLGNKPPEIVMFSIADLFVPEWNPRKFMDEGEMLNLMAYREKGGQVPPIVIWKGVSQAPWAIISGQRRWIADQRLGKTHIAAILMDISLEEAKILAITSNEGVEIHWLDWVIAVEKLYDAQLEKSQDKLGVKLGVTGARINYALKVAKALTSASRELIVKQLNALGPKKAVSERPVLALANLNDPQLVEKALPVLLDRKMTEPVVKKLVEWVSKGNSPETFKSGKVKGEKGPAKAKHPAVDVDKLVELAQQAAREEDRKDPNTTYRDQLKATLAEVKAPYTNADMALVQPNQVARPEASQQVTQTISRREGLAILGQQIGKAVGGLTAGIKTGHSEDKLLKTVSHYFHKAGEWIVKKGWRWVYKISHHFAKGIANTMVPVRKFGHKHQSGRSTLPPIVPSILHWTVYTFSLLFFWWVVIEYVSVRWIPWLKPYLEWPFRFLAHQVFVALPALAWSWGTSHLVPAAVVIGLLALGIYYAFRVQPARMALLCALLFTGWYYGRTFAEERPSPQVTGISSPAGTQKVESLKVSNLQTFTPLNFQTASSTLPASSSSTLQTFTPSNFSTSLSPATASVASVSNRTPTAMPTDSTPLPASIVAASNTGGRDSSETASTPMKRAQAADPPATSTQKPEISSSTKPRSAVSNTSVNMTTPTPQKSKSNDALGQVAGSVAQQIGGDAVGSVAKKLFGL